MAEGPTSRWWQEQEQPSKTSRQASERVARAAAPISEPELELDTWAELEAETLRRSQTVDGENSEIVAFYMDKGSLILKYRQWQQSMKRVVSVWFLLQLLLTAYFYWFLTKPMSPELPSLSVSWFTCFRLVAWFVLGQVPLLLLMARVKRVECEMENLNGPTIQLCPQGLQLNWLYYSNLMLPWKDITSIEPNRLGKFPYLDIHGTKEQRFIIYEHHLPLTLEALAEHIAAYKAARQIA